MDLLLLSEKEIRDLVGPAEALPAVRDAFVRLARGEAILPGVIHLDIPNSGAEAHVKGAHLGGSRFFTIKVASGSYANPDRGQTRRSINGVGIWLAVIVERVVGHADKSGVLPIHHPLSRRRAAIE